MAITQDYILKGGLAGSDAAANSRLKMMDEERIKGQENKSKEGIASRDNDAKLAQLIKGKQLDQSNAQQAIQDKIGGLKQLQDSGMVPEGGQVGVEGVTVGKDPYLAALNRTKGADDHAMKDAVGLYNKEVAKLTDTHGKISGALAAVNDPKQMGSAGIAKSALINAVSGMNRYNQQEGQSLVPGTWGEKANTLLMSLGDGNNPMTDQQRQSVNALLMEAHKGIADKHADLLSRAHGTYKAESPEFNAGRDSSLDAIAKPFGSRIQSTTEQWTPKMAPASPAMPQKTGGFMERAGDALHALIGKPPAQVAPAAGGTQTKQVGGRTYVRTPEGWVPQ